MTFRRDFNQRNWFFMVYGVGKGKYELTSFDAALLNAGVGDVNISRMSSILPPFCSRMGPEKLKPGRIIPMAYAYKTMRTEKPIFFSAAVSVAVPEREDEPGLIMECAMEHEGPTDVAVIKVIEMAKEGMANRGREAREILTKAVTIEAERELYTTVFAAVVLVNFYDIA